MSKKKEAPYRQVNATGSRYNVRRWKEEKSTLQDKGSVPSRSLSGCPIRPGATRRAPRGTGFGIAIFQAGAKRHFEVTHDKPIGTSQSHAMEKRHGRLALARLRLLSQVLSYLMFRASRTTA